MELTHRLLRPFRMVMAVVALAIAVVGLSPATAGACSCMPVTAAEMLDERPVVFVGTEVARQQVAASGHLQQLVTFEVETAYKGDVTPEMNLRTGMGGGDCGIGPQPGLVGVAAYEWEGNLVVDICGGLHDPAAIAAIADPIELIDAAPSPPEDTPAGAPWGSWLLFGALAVAAGASLIITRRRNRTYQDGWRSDA